ncbi:MAG: hypothetical protein ACRC75_12610, partial [Olsenella sp.]
SLGAGDDTATITYKHDAATVNQAIDRTVQNAVVNGGAGDDSLTVAIQATDKGKDGSYSSFSVSGGTGNDVISVSGKSGATAVCTVTVSGDAGDDVINPDATLHGVADLVTIDGGTGADKINLTGSLATKTISGMSFGKISGSRDNIYLAESGTDSKKSETELHLAISGMEAYTDALSNKARVDLSLDEDGKLTYSDPITDFTDYVLDASKVVFLKVTNTLDSFLSNLKLNASQIYYIYAPALNVYSKNVNITVGNSDPANADVSAESLGVPTLGITGRNISLVSYDADDNASFKIPLADTFVNKDISIDLSFFDVSTDAFVKICKDAVLDASESVLLSATSSQTRGFLPIAAINAITVKVGSAKVEVGGTIDAGTNVELDSTGTMTIACDSSTLADLSKIPVGVPLGFPLAVAVGVLDNGVFLDGAIVNAGGSLIARAITNTKITAVSTTGALPISLAVSVGVIDTKVEFKDSTITTKGDVNGVARSSVIEKASASLPKAGTSYYSSGGFFAVSVVINKVKADITGTTTVDAGGGINMRASSYQNMDTQAVAGKALSASTTSATATPPAFTMAQVTKLI